jgi:ubiquinone/menaquinone biosynthesis C-methylase UbiE
MSMSNTSYDSRSVRYENIHHITPEQFDALNTGMNLQNGQKMLDVGCGYGSATREIMLRNTHTSIEYFLLDQSFAQLENAKTELAPFTSNVKYFFNTSVFENQFEDACFDKILAKKVIHEFPKAEQEAVIAELYRILAPGGTLVVWQNVLDEHTQPFFQKTMLKKDALAGFDTLVSKRYFPEEKFFLDCLNKAGFVGAQKYFEFDYHVETTDRLDSELHGDLSLLQQWNDYLKGLINENPLLEAQLQFTHSHQSVGFTIKNAIYLIQKQ